MEETKFYTVGELNEMGKVKIDKNAEQSSEQLSYFSLEDLKKLGSVGKAFGVMPIEIDTTPVVVRDLNPSRNEIPPLCLMMRSTKKKDNNGKRIS